MRGADSNAAILTASIGPIHLKAIIVPHVMTAASSPGFESQRAHDGFHPPGRRLGGSIVPATCSGAPARRGISPPRFDD